MGQSLKAAINTETKAIERLRSAFRTARYCGYQKDWLNNRITEIYNNLPKGFAISRRNTLHAIQSVLWNEMMERDMEFVYSYKDQTYSVNKNSKHHKLTSKMKPIDCVSLAINKTPGAFWWIEKGKPYEPFTVR
jgi:tRNA(Glu) U13 pseudouridine synthase TruD